MAMSLPSGFAEMRLSEDGAVWAGLPSMSPYKELYVGWALGELRFSFEDSVRVDPSVADWLDSVGYPTAFVACCVVEGTRVL